MRTIKTTYTRKCQISSNHKGEAIIFSVMPNELIDIRFEGHKQHFQISLEDVANLAIIKTNMLEQSQKMKDYKIKRDAGYKVRKPKILGRVYNEFYYKALKV